MMVGVAVDKSLDEQVAILVPSIPAYGLGKALSSGSRTGTGKQAKDLVYLYELLRREALRRQLRRSGCPVRPPVSSGQRMQYLSSIVEDLDSDLGELDRAGAQAEASRAAARTWKRSVVELHRSRVTPSRTQWNTPASSTFPPTFRTRSTSP